jgi:hypothetical protein
MTNRNLPLAREVARQLMDAERAIDHAFQATAQLAAFMPHARLEANASAELGQAAFDRAAAAMTMLSGARREIVATHVALAETQVKLGLSVRNFGGFVDKPHHKAALLEVVEAA